jgi:hypothetical protein
MLVILMLAVMHGPLTRPTSPFISLSLCIHCLVMPFRVLANLLGPG